MWIIGIDIGSLSTKVVLLEDGGLKDMVVARSTYRFKEVGQQLLDQILEKNHLTISEITKIITTGYGRKTLDLGEQSEQITEITAHARGAQYFFPKVQSIIDIGGQDSKVILLSKRSGKVLDFQMNDKCAAGTGRFLEVMAGALEVKIAELGPLGLNASHPEPISSTCTVFAESEVISLFAKGTPKEDIAAGLHQSIGKRVGAMAKRLQIIPPVVFCGGVAKNPAVKKALEEELGMTLDVPEHPQITGALGAALIAFDKIKEARN